LHFSNTLTGQILCRFASKADLIFVFDAPDSLLNMRRPEACLDPSIHGRRFLYRAFPKRLNEYTIYSDVSPDIIWRKTSNLVAEKIKVSFGSVGKTKIYAKVRLPVLKRIFQYRPVMLASNWFFQGVFGCTWSERLFRLTLEAIIAFPTFTLFSIWINLYISAMLSIILAHSLNWVFNGNLSALILQHNIWVSRNGVSDVAHKSRYLDMLKRKSLEMPDVVLAIATFGSLSRGEFTESSDLDVIIIRKPGFVNWVKSNFFALSLRSIAFIRKVPLDLHVLDNVDQMEGRIRPDENAVLIYDPSEVFLRKM
jgi:predicted nucleotidyltransferase